MSREDLFRQAIRTRRGKVIVTPKKWAGRTVSAQTIRSRQSKKPKKLRRYCEFSKRSRNLRKYECKDTDHRSLDWKRRWGACKFTRKQSRQEERRTALRTWEE